MLGYLVFALLIILVICLIYYVWIQNNDKKLRRDAAEHINLSAGTYDDAAENALAALNGITNPRPADLIQRAEIMRYNVLDGDLRTRTLRRRTALGNIVRDYNNALMTLPAQMEFADMLLPTIVNFGADVRHINLADDYELAQLIGIFGDNLNTTAPAINGDIIRKRKTKATTNAQNHAQAVDNYLADATKYTSHKQSAHDNKVNSDLRAVLKMLRDNSRDVNPVISIAEARRYIDSTYIHAGDDSGDSDNQRTKATDALKGLDRAAKHEYITTYGDHEDRIFAYVWDRCSHPRNAENSDLMREAVINSLADGMENGTQVCINGRCSRILTSLSTLDFDREISAGALTFEAYRNMMFKEAGDIFDREVESAAASDDENMRAVAGYISGNGDVDRKYIDQFVNTVKEEIDTNLEQYKDKFTSEELHGIKTECYVAVEI